MLKFGEFIQSIEFRPTFSPAQQSGGFSIGTAKFSLVDGCFVQTAKQRVIAYSDRPLPLLIAAVRHLLAGIEAFSHHSGD